LGYSPKWHLKGRRKTGKTDQTGKKAVASTSISTSSLGSMRLTSTTVLITG